MSPHWLLRGASLAAVVAMFLAVAGCGGKAGKAESTSKDRPLIWAGDTEGGAPYVFEKEKGGQVYGFEVDLADALSKELGRKLEFKQYPFKELVLGLNRGDFDFAMNGLEVTEDRKQVLRFTRPYYVYTQQLVVRANDDRFKTWKDLVGQKVMVGTLVDTAAARFLKESNILFKTYDDQVTPYTDLAQKANDAVILDTPIAHWVVRKDPERNEKLKFVGAPFEPGHYAIAFRPKDEALAKQVDAALEKVIHKGELKKILEKWEIWNDDQKALLAK